MTARAGAIGTNVVGGMSADVDQGMLARATLAGAGSLSGILYKAPGSGRFAGAGGLSFEAAITQVLYLHPDADDTDGSWTNEAASATNLFASIDESWPAVDTDYIQSVHDPAPDICKIRLSNPAGSLNDPTRVRTKYYSRGESPGTLVVRLKQGATEIASWTYGNIAGIPTASVETLTAPQLAAITDPTDLFLWFEASGYAGPGDIVSGGTGFWGLRAYTFASIGTTVIRLREDGGNTEQDFVTIAGGGLDLAAISTFKGANNLFVVTLKDQTALAADVTMSTAGTQPPFTLNAIGALPAIDWTLHELGVGAFVISAPATMSSVIKHTANASYDGWLGGGTTSWELRINPTGFIESMSNNAALLGTSSGAFPAGVWGTTLCTIGGGAGAFFINGAASGTYVSSPTFGGGFLRLGCGQQFNSEQWIGSVTEWALWSSVLDGTQAAALDANQRGYWGF